MNTTELKRVIVTNPGRVIVKYADGQKDHYDNDISEVIVEGEVREQQ